MDLEPQTTDGAPAGDMALCWRLMDGQAAPIWTAAGALPHPYLDHRFAGRGAHGRRPNGARRPYERLKRGIDFSLALAAVVLLSPLLVLLAALVWASSPGPVSFRQERLGRGGRLFVTYKFRTMTHKHRCHAEVYERNPEVTTIGALLRRFKLDELPQCINVIRGDMAIVGPRPALPDNLADYTPFARRRLDVRPGLTGLAQVNGNIYLSWPERWEYDVRYVDGISLRLDLVIALKTIAVVLAGERAFAHESIGIDG